MTHPLVDKLISLFPEVRNRASSDDRELPYVMMTHLISYLEQEADRRMLDATTKRVEEFGAWCKSQPEGKDAGDDARTIAVVGLCEKVIRSDKLYPLAVRLLTKDEFIGGRQYLLRWVSEPQYARVLALYDRRRK